MPLQDSQWLLRQAKHRSKVGVHALCVWAALSWTALRNNTRRIITSRNTLMRETSIRGGARISEALALLNKAEWISSKAIRKPNKWPKRGFSSRIEVDMHIVLTVLNDDSLGEYLARTMPADIDTKKSAEPLNKAAFWKSLLDLLQERGMEREALLLSESTWHLQEGAALTLWFYSTNDLQLALSFAPDLEAIVREMLQADNAFRVHVQAQTS